MGKSVYIKDIEAHVANMFLSTAVYSEDWNEDELDAIESLRKKLQPIADTYSPDTTK